MERGILKRLPEILWQHEIDSLSILVGFMGPGFEYISKSPALPSNLRSTFFLGFFFFLDFMNLFSVKMLQIQIHTKKDKMPLSLFNDQPSRKGKIN